MNHTFVQSPRRILLHAAVGESGSFQSPLLVLPASTFSFSVCVTWKWAVWLGWVLLAFFSLSLSLSLSLSSGYSCTGKKKTALLSSNETSPRTCKEAQQNVCVYIKESPGLGASMHLTRRRCIVSRYSIPANFPPPPPPLPSSCFSFLFFSILDKRTTARRRRRKQGQQPLLALRPVFAL